VSEAEVQAISEVALSARLHRAVGGEAQRPATTILSAADERREPIAVATGIELEHDSRVRAGRRHLVEGRSGQDTDEGDGAGILGGSRDRDRTIVVEQGDRAHGRQHHWQRHGYAEERRCR